MRIIVDATELRNSFAFWAAREEEKVAAGVTIGLGRAAEAMTEKLRAQYRAVFKQSTYRKAENTIRSVVYPLEYGLGSLSPAAIFFWKQNYGDIFLPGSDGIVRPRRAKALTVILPEAFREYFKLQNSRKAAKKIVQNIYRNLKKPEFGYRKSSKTGSAILGKEDASGNFTPLFLITKSVKLKKRFDFYGIVERAGAQEIPTIGRSLDEILRAQEAPKNAANRRKRRERQRELAQANVGRRKEEGSRRSVQRRRRQEAGVTDLRRLRGEERAAARAAAAEERRLRSR
jgi:hypothetical protein